MSIYESQKSINPAFPFIFHDTFRGGCPHSQPDNWHENIEILAFVKGEAEVKLNDKHISVAEGDIIVVNANHLHSVNSCAELHYYCLIVDHSFCLANQFDTNKMVFFEKIRDRDIFSKMRLIAEEFEKLSPYHEQFIRAYALDIFARLCRFYSTEESVSFTESHILSCIKRALGYIHAHYKKDITLDEIAEHVGLSKFYFAREFRRITGYTLVSYVNLVRCQKARHLLAEGNASIGVISEECGFSSQSYFTKIFTSYTGRRPGEYRHAKNEKKD